MPLAGDPALLVFSFDEKTQCQALDRTQPSLPMKSGRAGTMTHDYKRHGTIDLFAAMNVATGEVLTDLRKGHTGADVLRFFKQIDATVPRGLGVHVVLDNLSAHSTPEIAKWLAHKDRRRWHLHYTPTSSSWLNLIERWFKELTDKRLRRGAVHQRRRPHRRDHHLGRALERQPQAVHLESHRRGHHRQGPAGTRNPQPDQIADGPLAAEKHHSSSYELSVTHGQVWPKCGHRAEIRNQQQPSVPRAHPTNCRIVPSNGNGRLGRPCNVVNEDWYNPKAYH